MANKPEEAPYNIETRYPGDFPEFTRRECRQAYEAATAVKAFVLKKIQT